MSKLLSDVEAFMARTNMSATAFGQNALGDRHFVRQLRGGRRTWSETEEKVRTFMRSYSQNPSPASAGKSAGLTAAQQSEAA